ncbi:helix-turn-helix domain-containing protein [Acidisoma cellulosilytica]|uniref:Helix-turn-helix domain-containing protein n=1 Tax=Acidisoma cellulosilyticum TaxID=2802395 RepID=A0A963Z1W3_9PROT|nr:helix-turn-helix domain-containing protein [Acidisoma cellulosilyticum]MCB8881245.1 helix-turn-helix domain-containing protein [Acidisoma cellulosilyticum]
MASQAHPLVLDPASPLKNTSARPSQTGSLTIRSTLGIPAAERLDYWRHAVLARMDPIRLTDAAEGFRGRMTHIVGTNCDFVDHASDEIHTRRDLTRLQRDGCDDLIISLVGESGSTRLNHAGEHRLRGNDLCIADFSKPIEHVRSRHRDVTLIFRRQKIEEIIKGDLSILAGRRLPRTGIASLLRSHMRCLAEESAQLSQSERAGALAAAAEMAFMALQSEFAKASDEAQFPTGLYAAAMTFIRRNCWDADLDPHAVVLGLGCSRATLYRIFAARDESIAKTIWNTRLDLAHRMLTACEHRHLFVEEIGFRNGFADIPTFNRMFKRRYGGTPTEIRNR